MKRIFALALVGCLLLGMNAFSQIGYAESAVGAYIKPYEDEWPHGSSVLQLVLR